MRASRLRWAEEILGRKTTAVVLFEMVGPVRAGNWRELWRGSPRRAAAIQRQLSRDMAGLQKKRSEEGR